MPGKPCPVVGVSPDTVILGMIMPVMGGERTYDGIKEIKPDIRVLFSNGALKSPRLGSKI